MPDDYVYIIDAFIKTGAYTKTWVEIKGWLSLVGKRKWEWFHAHHSNSELWDKARLINLGIITKRGKPCF